MTDEDTWPIIAVIGACVADGGMPKTGMLLALIACWRLGRPMWVRASSPQKDTV